MISRISLVYVAVISLFLRILLTLMVIIGNVQIIFVEERCENVPVLGLNNLDLTLYDKVLYLTYCCSNGYSNLLAAQERTPLFTDSIFAVRFELKFWKISTFKLDVKV